jgi:hypothetical protein
MITAALAEASRTTVDAPAPRLFHVHLFAVVRREVRNVAAPSLRDAVEAAFAQLSPQEFSERFDSDATEFADEFSHYLIDVDGDDEFTQSRFLTSVQEPLLELLRRLIVWHDGGRPEGELDAILVEARVALTGAV